VPREFEERPGLVQPQPAVLDRLDRIRDLDEFSRGSVGINEGLGSTNFMRLPCGAT
jgi:hypothetical protein